MTKILTIFSQKSIVRMIFNFSLPCVQNSNNNQIIFIIFFTNFDFEACANPGYGTVYMHFKELQCFETEAV